MTSLLTPLVTKAATGDANAFTELMVALHQDLRVWLASYAANSAMINTAEREVWTMLRRELLSGVPETAITLFLHQLAGSVVERVLKAVANNSQRNGDAVMAVMTTDGLHRLDQPHAHSNQVAKDILAKLSTLPDEQRTLLHDLHIEHKPLYDIAEQRQIPLSTLAKQLFILRQQLLDINVSGKNKNEELELATMIGCHLDGTLIPTDLARLQNRISAQPIDATIFAQQGRVYLMLGELLNPQAHTTARLLAAEITQAAKPRTRTDSSMVRAVDRGTTKGKRFDFSELPPTPPIAPSFPLLPVVIGAAALVVLGVITLLFVWANPKPIVPQKNSENSHTQQTKTTPTSNAATTATSVLPVTNNATNLTSQRLRGINLGGERVIIGGNSFIGQQEAETVGLTVIANATPASPGTIFAPGLDFDQKAMLESGVLIRDGAIVLRQKASPGNYRWWIWLSDPQGLQLNNVVVKTTAGEQALLPPATNTVHGRFGPFSSTSTANELQLSLLSLRRGRLAGIEIEADQNPAASLPNIYSVAWPTLALYQGDHITLPIKFTADGSQGLSSSLFIDDHLVNKSEQNPYTLTAENIPAGKHTFRVQMYQNGIAVGQPQSHEYTIKGGTLGMALHEIWDDETGNNIKGFLGDDDFAITPTNPSQLDKLYSYEPTKRRYFQRIRGFIVPPITGSYVFQLSAKSNGEFYLSQNETVNNSVLLLATKNNSILKFDSSSPIHLTADKRYYFELLHKCANEIGHVIVGWKMPDGREQTPIPGLFLNPAKSSDPVFVKPIEE
jgi:DNA-directed RNA polymerase specialized sigma24 family protein